MRKTVVKISKKGWRLTKKGVEEMMEQMGDTISRQTVVVFYDLENGFFYEKMETGRKPKADNESYHFKGTVRPDLHERIPPSYGH